ncbi:MAG: HAMP domain-containing sensor histidine kinase [Raoultibacter sp.]
MVVAIVILVLVVIVLAIQLIRSEKELRSIAQFLARREATSNARVTISVRTRGFQELGKAINHQLEAHQSERIAIDDQTQKVQKGLTYLSHDIRTPLAGAKGYAQLLEGEANSAEQDRYLEAVGRRLDDASSLLDQLFTYAQVQDPDFHIERDQVDANAVLTNSLVFYYTQFREKGWEPVVDLEDEELALFSDADALGRIFRNLAGNALRYGIDAPLIEQRGAIITFSNRVADPDSLDATQLFERFYRGDTSRTDGGSGLGLAIVAQLSRMLAIDVNATLVEDRLMISLTLPVDQRA